MINPVAVQSARSGHKRTINVGALTGGDMVQYDRDHADLKYGNRKYGAFNSIYIVNRSASVVYVDLDFDRNRRIILPGGVAIAESDIMYQEFNVIAGGDVEDGELYITVIFERPLAKEPCGKKDQYSGCV